MRRGIAACAVATVLILAAAPAGAAVVLDKVLGGPEAQFLPFANETHLIWTQNSEARPNHYNAFGGALDATGRFRLNDTGTNGFTGGIDPGTNVAIYQQTNDGRSNLFLFDLDTRVRTKLPAPVNSPRWEWAPRISTSYILFQRDENGRTNLYLYDRTAETLDQIHSVDPDRAFLYAGSVGESYASWTVCGQGCNAFVYEIAGNDKTKLPVPVGKHQYAPTVDEATGEVYFVRSGNACGANVGIWRRPVDLSALAERIISLPDGIDTGWTLALDVDTGNARLDAWFEYHRCRSRQGDLYEAQGLRALT
jgi:hypothetical protein